MTTFTNRASIYILLSTAIITVLCFYYVDRQVISVLIAHQSRDFGVLKLFSNSITDVIGTFIVLFYIYFGTKLLMNKLYAADKQLIVMCNSVVISTFFKDILKGIFGRYWAETFTCQNPSLIRDNAYGFNWFAIDGINASFPSGHAAFIFSFSVSMGLLFPRLRWLWGLLAILVLIGQIGMYYHFVSDVIAGAVLGGLVAFYNYRYSCITS